MKLIQGRTHMYFPEFATSLQKQSPAQREQGRSALIDFTTQDCIVTPFTDSTELHNALLDRSRSPAGSPRRRLFVLEDLPCNHILALGSKLRIPPSFFAGHYNDPATPTFNHRNPFQRCLRPHFRIRYATSNSVRADDRAEPNNGHMRLYAFDTNVSRYMHEFCPRGLAYEEVWSYHISSFWSSEPRDDGSWDAVLLVDPPPKNFVRCPTTGNTICLRPRLQPFLYPELDIEKELSQDLTEWNTNAGKPGYKSMFDDSLQHYDSEKRLYTSMVDPWQVVEFPRKLVLASLLAYIRGRYLVLMTCQRTQLSPHALRSNYLCSFSGSSFSSWSNSFFDFMFGSCAAMKEWSREIEENMTALAIESSAHDTPQWEVDGWQSFREISQAVEAMTTAFAENYISYATISEAHTSNGSAQSLSKITLLTMLFIPLSTVASIFSMSDDFLPGETRSWIFWAVTIPVLLALAVLYWRKKLTAVWWARREALANFVPTDSGMV